VGSRELYDGNANNGRTRVDEHLHTYSIVFIRSHSITLFEATNSPKGLSGGDPVFGNTISLPLLEDIQFIGARFRRHIDNSAYA
jgi:hypothetical protein